jgi:hypothetical protein
MAGRDTCAGLGRDELESGMGLQDLATPAQRRVQRQAKGAGLSCSASYPLPYTPKRPIIQDTTADF